MSRPCGVSRVRRRRRAEEIVIKIENFTFNPAEITIKPGTTVTWQNGDDIPHSVVEDNDEVSFEGSRYGRNIFDDIRECS